MKKMNVVEIAKKMTIIASLAVATAVKADLNDIELGDPAYGGTGCPAGSASAALSEDKKSLSIIFDQFVVEAPAASNVPARKNCNIAIPVHVPQGYSVSVVDVDYRGYVSLPSQADARLTAEYFLAGYRGPTYSKLFIGRTDTDYVFNNEIGIQAQVWSPCGADTILRVNASMLVRNKSYRDAALATVDTADFRAGIKYKFQWRRCQ